MPQVEVDIKRQKVDKEEEKKKENYEIPIYSNKIKLSESQQEKLVTEILDELKAIEQERKELGFPDKWNELENQYEGNLRPNADMQFNLHRHTSKIKGNAVSRAIKQAYFESDPMYSITPRPEFAKRDDALVVCEKQADYLDYKLDFQIPLKPSKSLVIHSAVSYGLGWQKWWYVVRRQKRTREETYKAELEPVTDAEGKHKINPETGEPLITNKGLERFVKNYKEEIEKNPKKYGGYLRRLSEGKDINIVVEYYEIVYDDPFPIFVDIRNLYVRKGTDGYWGLGETKLIAELKTYSYWELMQEEREKQLENIDVLTYEDEEDKDGKKKRKPNYANESYELFECTVFFKINEDDEEETKIICWINRDKKSFHGAIQYPYPGLISHYNPHIIRKKKVGIYQPGLLEDLTDNNIAEDAFLNFTLEGLWAQNTITPITTEDSLIAQQFLEKRFLHGLPIERAPNEEFDFLQRYMKPMDLGGIVMVMQILQKDDDDVSGVSQLTTGRESEIDPTAPAAKTVALLEQSGINVKEYIEEMTPAFNTDAYIIMMMYYQMSRQGRQYIVKKVVGADPFKTIERDEMIARTNIQAQAMAFDFEKQNEKKLDVALYQILRPELMVTRRPESVYNLVRGLIKGWSQKWKNRVDSILPPLEQIKQEQAMVALQALQMYVKQVQAKAQLQGQPPQYKVEELIPLMNDLQAQALTPPDPKAIKESERRG